MEEKDQYGPPPTFIFKGVDLLLLLTIVFNEGRESLGGELWGLTSEAIGERLETWKARLVNMPLRADGSSYFDGLEHLNDEVAIRAEIEAAQADSAPLH